MRWLTRLAALRRIGHASATASNAIPRYRSVRGVNSNALSALKRRWVEIKSQKTNVRITKFAAIEVVNFFWSGVQRLFFSA